MARSTGALKHIHQYFQFKQTNGQITWNCRRDGCTHFVPLNIPPPIGKQTICWGCEKPTTFMPNHLDQEYPRCEKCANTFALAQQIIENMEKEINLPFKTPSKSVKPIQMVKKKKEPQLNDEIEVIEPDSQSNEIITDDYPWLQGGDEE